MPEAADFVCRRNLPARPRTFDDATRSVRAVAAAETPVRRIDPELKIPVDMIHRVDGVVLPESGQVPLLDSHNRVSVSAVLGSARNFQMVGGALECDVFFSGTQDGKLAARKVKEGHLTDFSVGYFWDLKDSERIPTGRTRTVAGRTIRGPARIIEKWHLLELSLVMKGADPLAKARKAEAELTERSAGTTPKGPAPSRQEGFIDRIFWWLAAFIGASLLISLLLP
jgi:hypothetical protein